MIKWLFEYSKVFLIEVFCPLSAAVNDTALKLNETLGVQDKTLEKSLQALQQDVDKMVAELRKRRLDMQEETAQDELE